MAVIDWLVYQFFTNDIFVIILIVILLVVYGWLALKAKRYIALARSREELRHRSNKKAQNY